MDVFVVIYCDNISSILLINNPIYHVGTKHIEGALSFCQRKSLVGEINLIHVSTKN
jgi:hypothetical protein